MDTLTKLRDLSEGREHFSFSKAFEIDQRPFDRSLVGLLGVKSVLQSNQTWKQTLIWINRLTQEIIPRWRLDEDPWEEGREGGGVKGEWPGVSPMGLGEEEYPKLL